MDEQGKTTFGKAVYSERKRMEMTQAQLAAAVGTTQQNVAGWEKGKSLPRDDTFQRLVDLFGPHSPVAALPPRGEIRLALDTVARAQLVHEHQVPYGDTIDVKTAWLQVPAPEQQNVVRELAKFLPEPYSHNIEPLLPHKGIRSRPDYLSDTICAEAKRITSNRLELSARTGMQQLMVFRAALADMPIKHSKPLAGLLFFVHKYNNLFVNYLLFTNILLYDSSTTSQIRCNNSGETMKNLRLCESVLAVTYATALIVLYFSVFVWGRV